MAVTRIKNNQITDATVVANAKLVDYSISSAKLANNLTYNSDFTVAGNLTVQGNTTTIDTTITTIEDPVIVLASTQTSGAPAVDIGFLGYRGNQSNIAFVWDESASEFVTAFTSTGETNTTITVTSYADFHTNNANISGNLVVGGNIDITGNISSLNVTGNITGGNLLSPGLISATANVTGGNIVTGGQVVATSNITGGNVLTGGLISATSTITSAANITGGNVLTGGVVSATANVTGGNIVTGGQVVATSNITGGNVLTGGLISATSTITSAANITGGNVLTGGLISATSTITSAANITGGNLLTGGLISATANVTGGNILTGGAVSATGNISGGNIISGNAVIGNIDVSGNITVNSLTSNTFVSASGNIIGANVFTGGAISAAANVTGGNVLTGGLISATSTITSAANITGGNVLTGGLISATSTITSAANITGGNLITGGAVSATANVTGGNLITGGLATVAGNVTGGNILTGGQVSATGNVTANNVNTDNIYSTGSLTLTADSGDLTLNPSGNIVMDGGKYINNVLDPVQAQDAATKQYVDDAVSSGIHIHTPVYLETPVALPSATYAQGGNTFTVNQTIAGNTVVFTTAANLQVNDQLWFTNSFEGIVGNTAYFVVSTPNTSAAVLTTTYNGAPVSNITSNTGLTQSVRVNSGIGATLTGSANGALSVDGVAVSSNNRILVYQQSTAYENGVYVVTQTGNVSAPFILTRSSDTDTYEPDSVTGIDEGSYFYVQAGDTGAGESYVMTAPTGPFIIGLANLTFTQFSASQVYTANTAAGLSLTGTVFSAKVDNNTTAFDGGGNIIVKAGANLTTPNIGAATGTSLSVTGNVTGGNVLTGGAVSATANVTGGNVLTGGVVSATANVTGGNILTGGLISATSTITSAANIIGGNLLTAGLISATSTITSAANITGGNVLTGGVVSATANVTGGNLVTGGLITATGAVTAGGFTTTGNVTGGNLLFGSGQVSGTGNVYATNFIGNISGNIDAAGANTQVQFNDGDLLGASAAFTFDKASNALVNSGNITGGNLLTGGAISATANITGGNLLTAGLISATSTITSAANITGGNVLTGGVVSATANVTGGNVLTGGVVSATANVTGGNVLTGGVVSATANVTGGNITTAGLITATGNITGGNLILAGAALDTTAGRLTVNSTSADADFAVNGDTAANILYIDAGTGTASFGSSSQTTNAIVSFNATNSVLMPVGNTGQRPSTGVTGMLRFNSTDNNLEIYNNTQWEAVGVPAFTVISDDQFNGDGSTVAFTLGSSQTTNSCIVSINGVVQIPTTAYSVSGTTLTFTEAPLSGDVIDVRQITTTTSVASISNGSGNAVVEVLDTADTVQITGNLLPVGDATKNLGSASKRWNSLYVAGNTIYLGTLQLKQTDASTFTVFKADGTTQANIDVGNVDVSSIVSGTSTIGIYGSGQAYMSVNGNANVLLASNTSVLVNGAFSATGNITGNYIFGNGSQLTGIDATSIQSGTSNVRVVSSGGNVTTGIGGTSNVVVVATTGQFVTGVNSVSGNVTGGNLLTAGLISATGAITGANITGGNILTAGIVSATGNIFGGNALFSGNLTVNGNVTYINSNVVTINDLAINLANNAATAAAANNGGIEVGPQGTPYITFLYNNSANSMVSSGGLSAVANVVGANLTTAGIVSATGNITGGNVAGTRGAFTNIAGTLETAAQTNITSVGTLGSLSVTGNVQGGNIRTAGLISATGAITGAAITGTSLTVSTGNVSCGNIVNTNANGVGNIGSASTYFNTVFAKATSAQYADLAEKYTADADYQPGTVVMFGGEAEVTICSADACRRVAGVISTNPSYIMNGTLQGAHVATVALTGRVPTRVTGTVSKGDLMVSAGNGAARAEENPQVGTVIGKALADFDGESGVIEVVVGRF